jgi:hypothetical protein
VNNVASTFPSKSIIDGETLPSSFFERLKDVAHLPDPFSFMAGDRRSFT